MLGQADIILTGRRSATVLTNLGADPKTLRMTGPGSLPDYFDGPVSPFDVADLEPAAVAAYAGMSLDGPVRAMLEANLRTPVAGPVIGVCGKVAESKGSYDLLAALEAVAEAGVDFTLLGALGGQEALLLPWLDALAATAHLRRRSIILPFLPQWRMPGFFDTCDVVCLLERSFDVTLHRTRVPWEVLHRGRTLILSDEISRKVHFSDQLVDRVNYLAVEDPEDIGSLVSVLVEALTQPALRAEVAGRGRLLAESLGERIAGDGPTLAIEDALAAIAEGAASGS
jgi:hypothetical protein